VARMTEASARGIRIAPHGHGYLFTVPSGSGDALRATVLDLQGRAVWTGVLPKGATTLAWNGLASSGQPIVRGMYFVRMAPASGAQGIVWESRFAHTR